MCFVWIWEKTAIISVYNINWLVFRCVGRIVKGAISFIMSVRHMEQLVSHWTDFHEVW